MPGEDDEPASTGFLPMSLAVGLFVTGLFVLGFVRCDPTLGPPPAVATP